MFLPARRTRENAVLTGVCAGLARQWGVDANLLRVALIILSFVSGLGLVLYGVGYLVLPTDDNSPAPIRRLLPFTRDWPLPALAITLTAAGFLAFGLMGGWSGVGLLPVLVALGIWYAASRRGSRPVNAPDPTPFERAAEAWRLRLLEHQTGSPGAALAIPAAATSSYVSSVPPNPAPTEVVRRERPRNNRLWWLALGLMLVGCTAVALLTPHGGGYHIAGLDYLAVVLVSLGFTLMLGTWLGRPRLMGLATVLVMISTGITWAAQSPATAALSVAAEEHYVFTSAADLPDEISYTGGTVDLDFSKLALATDAAIQVHLGAGKVVLRLPEKVNAEVAFEVGVGDVTLAGASDQSGANLRGSTEHTTSETAPRVQIDISLGAGSLEVGP